MSGISPRRRLQGLFWQHSLFWRRPARRLRRALALGAYRWRARRGAGEPARVVADLARDSGPPLPHPAVRVAPDASAAGLATQTETSVTSAGEAPFHLVADGDPAGWPPTLVESLLLAAAAEDLPLVAGGWTAPAAGRHGPSGEVDGFSDAADLPALVRAPAPDGGRAEPVVGRLVGHVTGRPLAAPRAGTPVVRTPPGLRASGPHLLGGDVAPGRVVRRRVRSPEDVLRRLPEVPGPRTALFLLPYLAVGGAERLLLDLLDGLGDRYRLLVATLEPHLDELGQTVDACRERVPGVYTLGDWLPRETHPGALRHLLRRYRVESLVCWNGVVDFYDGVGELRRGFAGLRVLNQLYNHEGGWIERYGPAVAAAVDVHLAVNRRIARALEARGVAPERVEVVYHGVRLPPEVEPAERARRRERRRDALGLPRDALVAGTFIRLHEQKRPLDVVRLARRFAGRSRPVWFLLAGGGPLAEEVDRELAREPVPNLVRLPLQDDVEPLFDAVDLCLLTSSYEGLPVFLLEGMARGLPCVATAVGEVPELLREGGGVLVERAGDLEALAAAIDALADDGRRRAEGRRARDVARRFGVEAYCRRYEELIFPAAGEGKDGAS